MSRLFPLPLSSIICLSDPRFYAGVLSSSDTVKCTPCQFANIMQIISNIEDSWNLMQICIQSSKVISAGCASIRENARVETEHESSWLTATQTNFHGYVSQLKFMRHHKFDYKWMQFHLRLQWVHMSDLETPQQLHIVLKEVWRLTTEVDFLMLKIINLHRGLIHLLDGYVRTSPMFNVYNPLV